MCARERAFVNKGKRAPGFCTPSSLGAVKKQCIRVSRHQQSPSHPYHLPRLKSSAWQGTSTPGLVEGPELSSAAMLSSDFRCCSRLNLYKSRVVEAQGSNPSQEPNRYRGLCVCLNSKRWLRASARTTGTASTEPGVRASSERRWGCLRLFELYLTH